uniref:CCHC-type domain-containing protein n=1 Tax=Chenopodium quinoa TaxID=63459 RepID=A0A803MT30_CHEQI
MTEDENKIVGENFEGTDEENTKAKISLTLVGKLLTVRPYNVEAMKRTLVNVWRVKDNVAIRMVETNLFVFQFFCEDDKIKVMEGYRWFFDKKLLLLTKIMGDEQPSTVCFSSSPFWVRIGDVPFNKRNLDFAFEIGEHLGGFLEFDDSDPLGWEAFLRIKIMVDINKPLRRGLKVANGSSSPIWCGMQYERLAEFCYYCGRLNHTDVECQFVEEDVVTKGVVYEYGPWLGASPKKQARGSLFDRERERSWLSKIKDASKPRLPGYFDPKAVSKGPPAAARKLTFSAP